MISQDVVLFPSETDMFIIQNNRTKSCHRHSLIFHEMFSCKMFIRICVGAFLCIVVLFLPHKLFLINCFSCI